MEILCKPEIPTRHISYHIHAHLQSFTRMWKISEFQYVPLSIEISCIEAFGYSEYMKRMFYCEKKEKFVTKRKRETELSNLWICITPKKGT